VRTPQTRITSTTTSGAAVAVPLTPPLNANAAAEKRAARRTPSRPVIARTTGSTTHGRTAPGSTSALRVATWLITCGFSP
jgi:hypothetical protein